MRRWWRAFWHGVAETYDRRRRGAFAGLCLLLTFFLALSIFVPLILWLLSKH